MSLDIFFITHTEKNLLPSLNVVIIYSIHYIWSLRDIINLFWCAQYTKKEKKVLLHFIFHSFVYYFLNYVFFYLIFFTGFLYFEEKNAISDVIHVMHQACLLFSILFLFFHYLYGSVQSKGKFSKIWYIIL